MRFVKTAESIFDIPSGFTRVEYLETSGSKYYIDTGYKANNTTKIEIKTQGQTWIFGGRTSLAVGDSLGVCFNANLVALQFGSQSINYNQTGIAQQVSECVISQDGAYINGVLQASFTSETFSCPNNLYLFDINNNGSLGDGLKGKMWYCKIWDNDTLVRDFIPCIDPLGVACMYDLVGKKPYYNLGTGTFTTGRQVIPVEYLESTGTQYIDTGYKPVPATTKFEFYFNPTTISGNYFLFGARPDTSIGGFTCTTYFATGNIRQDWAGLGSYFAKINAGDKVLYSAYDNTVSLNNDSATGTIARSTDRLNYNFLLFTVNTGGTVDSRMFVGKVYYAKLWDNGTLVRDYIPCKDENDNGFLFDKVSGDCYLNSGTGDFAFGENKYKTKLRLIKDNKLPAGYTQVEYLESTGTQYIDTLLAGNQDTAIECKFNTTSYTSTNYVSLLGYYSGTDNSITGFMGISSSYGRSRFGNTSTLDTAVSLNTDYVLYMDKTKFKLNNTETSWSCTNTFTTEGTLRLFSRYTETYGNFNGKIYYTKIWKDGELVRDYIPAIDPSGTPCMYDMVTRTPFYNQGTGTFSYGKPVLPMVRFIKDIVPREYAIVNYLESTGTQYIDTGIAPSNITPIAKMKFVPTQQYSLGSYGIFGCFGANNTRFQVFYNSIGIGTYVSKSWQANTTYEVELNGKIPSATINGTVETSGYSKTNGFSSYNMYLFTRNNSDIADSGVPLKLYYCKIWDNNTLIRNLIPVVRRIDKVAGMWDTVTKQFFTTPVGAFNYG